MCSIQFLLSSFFCFKTAYEAIRLIIAFTGHDRMKSIRHIIYLSYLIMLRRCFRYIYDNVKQIPSRRTKKNGETKNPISSAAIFNIHQMLVLFFFVLFLTLFTWCFTYPINRCIYNRKRNGVPQAILAMTKQIKRALTHTHKHAHAKHLNEHILEI